MQKYIVSDDVSEVYTDGKVLKDQSEVCGYYRALWDIGYKPPIGEQLTDQELFAVLDKYKSTDDPAADDGARLLLVERALLVKPTLVASGTAAKEMGIAFGKALPAEFDNVMTVALKAKEDTDELPIVLARIIDPLLPRSPNGQYSAPYPGSTDKTVKEGEIADRFRDKENNKNTVSSFYLEAFKQRPAGQRAMSVLAQMDKASGKDVVAPESIQHPDGRVTTISQFKSMDDKSKGSARDIWKGKLDFGGNKLRRAAAILFKMEACRNLPRIKIGLAVQTKENAPAITLAGYDVVTEHEEPIPGARKPFILGDTKKVGSTDAQTVTWFLSLKPEMLGESASLADLVKTAETPEPKDTATQTRKIANGDLAGFFDYLGEIRAWLEVPDNYKAYLSAQANGKLTEDNIDTQGTLSEQLSAFATRDEKKFELIAIKRQQESERQAAEQAAKLKKHG